MKQRQRQERFAILPHERWARWPQVIGHKFDKSRPAVHAGITRIGICHRPLPFSSSALEDGPVNAIFNKLEHVVRIVKGRRSPNTHFLPGHGSCHAALVTLLNQLKDNDSRCVRVKRLYRHKQGARPTVVRGSRQSKRFARAHVACRGRLGGRARVARIGVGPVVCTRRRLALELHNVRLECVSLVALKNRPFCVHF